MSMRTFAWALAATTAFAGPTSPRHIAAEIELVQRTPLKVRLVVPNPGDKVLKLDRQSVCADGKLSNDVFRVAVDGAPVEYRGALAKRGPPKTFEEVRPGEAYSIVVDLSSAYPVPDKGRITVRFETANHFSPDGGRLASGELTVQP
jgi:hypothetical protein